MIGLIGVNKTFLQAMKLAVQSATHSLYKQVSVWRSHLTCELLRLAVRTTSHNFLLSTTEEFLAASPPTMSRLHTRQATMATASRGTNVHIHSQALRFPSHHDVNVLRGNGEMLSMSRSARRFGHSHLMVCKLCLTNKFALLLKPASIHRHARSAAAFLALLI